MRRRQSGMVTALWLLAIGPLLNGCGGAGNGTPAAAGGGGGGGGGAGGAGGGGTARFAAPIDLGTSYASGIGKNVITGTTTKLQPSPLIRLTGLVVWPVGAGPSIAPLAVPTPTSFLPTAFTSVNEQDQVVTPDGRVLTNATSASPSVVALTGPSGSAAAAIGINNAGVVVGDANVPGATVVLNPAFWPAGQTTATLMNPLPGDTAGSVYAASAQGIAIGQSVRHDALTPVLWPKLVANQPPSPVVLPGTSTPVGPVALNINSQVVGSYSSADGVNHNVTWNMAQANPQVVEIGGLGGTTLPHGINTAGQIVGESGSFTGPSGTQFAQGISHAFLWEPGANGMQDLNNMIPAGTGWTLQSATAMNDEGMIVGLGILNGTQHSFLLTPASNRAAAAPPRQTTSLRP